MAEYIATFFTHNDAILFQRRAQGLSLSGQLAPVPRRLSSSCGTCLLFQAAPEEMERLAAEGGFERLVRREGEDYITEKDNR